MAPIAKKILALLTRASTPIIYRSVMKNIGIQAALAQRSRIKKS